MNHNIDTALQEVQNRITQSSNSLPTALYPPVITKTNPEDQPIIWVMVTADDNVPLYQQMIYARNTLQGPALDDPGRRRHHDAGLRRPQPARLDRHEKDV